MKFWRDHSLSLTLAAIGAILIAVAVPMGEGMAFDIVSMFGGTFVGSAIINLLAGRLYERNRPDRKQ